MERAEDQRSHHHPRGARLEGKILVVLGRDDENAFRSFRNLMNVKTIDAGELNAYDVLDCDWVLFTDATLPTQETD